MKRIVRILAFICFVSLIASLFVLSSFAGESRVVDKSGCLSSSELASLEAVARRAEEDTGVLHRVFVSDVGDGYGYYYSRILEEFNLSTYDDVSVIFVEIDYDETYYELLTYGIANDEISDTEADRILDNSEVRKIKDGKIELGVSKALSLSATAINGVLRRSFLEAFLPALIIGAVAALAVAIAVIVRYKRKLKSATYPLERYTNMRLTVSRDTFLGKFVTRVRIRQNSGGSGGVSRGGGIRGGSRGRR